MIVLLSWADRLNNQKSNVAIKQFEAIPHERKVKYQSTSQVLVRKILYSTK
ncbi:hypothetical protein SF1_14780 [Sphingobacterium faecium NBRC 15299]|nr:hypothetical protein SF1_14780 [Sphingobacterium faecium NBRC 15299]